MILRIVGTTLCTFGAAWSIGYFATDGNIERFITAVLYLAVTVGIWNAYYWRSQAEYREKR